MPSKTTLFHRRHYFINRKLQGRYMVTFLIPMIVMLVFMLATLYFATLTIISTTTRILQKDIENAIALELQDQIDPSKERYKSVLANVAGRVKNFSESKDLKGEMLPTLLWVVGAGLLLLIIQIVFMTVFFSHKVAGPVYRFECILHDIIDGNYTDQVKLRKGDELQNLANLFNQAVGVTNKRLNDILHAESDEKKKAIASTLQL